MRFESDKTKEELIKSWDDLTSPARFAGNDDTMDLIFTAKRRGDKVVLVRRARLSRDPYSCVFRGRIEKTEKGSCITGHFTKSIFDYIFTALIIAGLFYIKAEIVSRGDDQSTVSALLAAAIVSGLLLLHNTKATKRRYTEFIFGITEKPFPAFLSRKEAKENQSDK